MCLLKNIMAILWLVKGGVFGHVFITFTLLMFCGLGTIEKTFIKDQGFKHRSQRLVMEK